MGLITPFKADYCFEINFCSRKAYFIGKQYLDVCVLLFNKQNKDKMACNCQCEEMETVVAGV